MLMTRLWKYSLIAHNNLLYLCSTSFTKGVLSQPVLAGSHTNICRTDLALIAKCRPQQVFIFCPYGAETRGSFWPSVLAKHYSPRVHLHGRMRFQRAKGWRGAKTNVDLQKFSEGSQLHARICRIQHRTDVKRWMFSLAALLCWPLVDMP